MLSWRPVTRLSMQTTSSPRSSNDSQMWDPRNPAPPVTTTLTLRCSRSADALVLEAGLAEPVAVEQVAGVDDARRAHRAGHLVEVEPAELVPLGEDDQHLGALARGVRVGGDGDAGRVGVDGRVVGGDDGTGRLDALHDLDGGRIADV